MQFCLLTKSAVCGIMELIPLFERPERRRFGPSSRTVTSYGIFSINPAHMALSPVIPKPHIAKLFSFYFFFFPAPLGFIFSKSILISPAPKSYIFSSTLSSKIKSRLILSNLNKFDKIKNLCYNIKKNINFFKKIF